MNYPLISVIIPAYNASKTIEVAITSILKQTYPRLEIIVINDNSTDNTEEIIQEFLKKYNNIKYYPLPYDDPNRFNKHGKNINAGYMARNYGFEKASGDWITFQDADDASLLNRIEVQYNLAKKYNSLHVSIDCQQLRNGLIGRSLDIEKIFEEQSDIVITKNEILKLLKKNKRFFTPFLGKLNSKIPFEFRRIRYINRIFFKSFDPYPCAGNNPLFKKEITETVKFRPLQERIWPSITGRGADRDFNFQIAETFKNSMCFKLPLYLWAAKAENSQYAHYTKYLRGTTPSRGFGTGLYYSKKKDSET